MTARKKKGVSLLIGGAAAIVTGIVIYTTTTTPAWLPTAFTVIGMVGKVFGFAIVFPDTD